MKADSDKMILSTKEYATKDEISFSDSWRKTSYDKSEANIKKLLKKFEENYRYMRHRDLYTVSKDFVVAMDGAANVFGYRPETGTRFRFKNIETDYLLGSKSIESFVWFPTLDFYPYKRNSHVLAQILLYDGVVLQYYGIVSKTLFLANEDNADFRGGPLEFEKLKEPQRVFLQDVLKNQKVKQIQKKELLSKLRKLITK